VGGNTEIVARFGVLVHLKRSFGLRPGLTTNAATDLLLAFGGTTM
jgi:hypothetical protein